MTRGDRYILTDSEAEAERLERQAALYGGAAFVDPFLDDALTAVLDVGCGSGIFTRHVAARAPRAKVVGLDLDPSRIAFAHDRATAPGLRFGLGNAGALPFADHRFDLVYCRFVLVHDRDPAGALREMARVTRPGGRVVAYDMIHEGIWFSPPKPALARLLAVTLDALREGGAEPNQGLHLPVAMKRVGLRDVQVEVIPHHAMSGDPLFQPYVDNWLDTVDRLAEGLADRLDAGLIAAARDELRHGPPDQFQIEIAVLAHGRA